MTISKSPRPMWNDVDESPDENYREIEEQVEMRARAKRLVDCELPDGFRLVTPEPKQYWLEHQLRWGFCVAWAGVHVEYRYVARYLQTVSDEAQLNWTIDDFRRELEAAGIDTTKRRGPAMMLRMAS